MTRLTNTTRDAIVKAALERTFKARTEAYEKARTALADALYDLEFAAGERTAKRLPEGWLGATKSIQIKHPDFASYQSWRGKPSGYLKLSKSRLFPSRIEQVKVEKGHACFKQAQDVAGLFQNLERDQDTLREKVRALVYGHNTVETLLKTWPEGKAYLPSTTPTPPANALVPVALAAEVNKLLGITAKTK